MLIGLDPLLTPDLLHALAAMGHGDTIALVDANYPARRGRAVIHLPGADIVASLRAVLSLLPIDTFVPHPAVVMQVVDRPDEIPAVCVAIDAVLAERGAAPARAIERHAFYAAAAEQAFAVVATGERRFYGNVIVTKGVIPPETR